MFVVGFILICFDRENTTLVARQLLSQKMLTTFLMTVAVDKYLRNEWWCADGDGYSANYFYIRLVTWGATTSLVLMT